MAAEGTAREQGQCAPVYNGRIPLTFLPIYVNKCVKKKRVDSIGRKEEKLNMPPRKVDDHTAEQHPAEPTVPGRLHRISPPSNQACLSLPPAHPPALSLFPPPMFCLDEQIQALVARLSLATEAEGAASQSS